MNKTSIEWTDFTSNPMKFRNAKTNQIVWGCVKTSPGCLHCYSETLALRYKQGKLFNAANMRELKPFMCDDELHKIAIAKKVSGVEVTGKRCFVGDMTDLFGEWVTDQMLDSLFRSMVSRKDITFQLLTKRAERMRKYCSDRWGTFGGKEWPLSESIWLGVSVEDQKRADERIPMLLQTPAAVRFLSCEPLLGSIDLSEWMYTLKIEHNGDGDTQEVPCRPGIDWVICGGESGPGARPMDVDWVRSIVEQCKAVDVPCFVKQLGADPREGNANGNCRDLNCTHPDCGFIKLSLKDKKGGDMSEWPADLRVREFPTPRVQCPTN